jgi:hypothetical protein
VFWSSESSLFCLEYLKTTEFLVPKHLLFLSSFLLPSVNLSFTEDTNEIILLLPISKFHIVNYWKVCARCPGNSLKIQWNKQDADTVYLLLKSTVVLNNCVDNFDVVKIGLLLREMGTKI